MNTGEFFDKVESMYKDWQYDHPRLLYSLIKLLRPAVALEVGTFMGYGACYMARALEENDAGHLYCIDNWQLPNPKWRPEPVKETFLNALSVFGLRGRVTLLEGDSTKIPWPDKIDFAYIDGWHSFQVARNDFMMASQAGATCICFDDTISVVGPRMLMRNIEKDDEWDVATLNSAAGLTICTRRSITTGRQVTFSQEFDDHPGMDLKDQQQIGEHLKQAADRTGLKYEL